MPQRLLLASILAILPATWSLHAHESFLPLHDFHLHQSHEHHEHHEHAEGKTAHDHDHTLTHRLEIASGVRYTRHSLHGEAAHLWETTVGFEYSATSWLHMGADVSYGWFDSDEGSADGLMVPHAHIDIHLPLGGSWELLASFGVGFPGGEENLVGDHWEFTPGIELRYDRHTWFASAGASFVFVEGGHHHHHDHHASDADESHEEHDEHGEEHDAHEEPDHDEYPAHHDHAHAGHAENDFHEIVDPHGSRELHYHVAFGVRPFDERLELESRLSAVHVTSGDTEDRNYLRAGLRASWKIDDRWIVSTQGSVPITDARRNEWQASLAVRVDF